MAFWEVMRLALLPLLMTVALSAQPKAGEGLRYRMQMWMRDEATPRETVFTVQTQAAAHTTNHVQKPRFGTWELRADRNQGTPYQQAALLNRAQKLLFLSSPVAEAHLQPLRIGFHGRSLPVWGMEVPAGLHASAILVEVAPKLLALCDLSARFTQGDVARIELHLEEAGRLTAELPAAEGTALLGTLQRWMREGED
ncbi:MAG TPA: hypothetical protein VJ505_03050 [Holophagaceae bacterium]|nr:hypothetical protein [Holophagaceae bacterium]